MNQAVLALRPLREAIGSEWRHKHLPGVVKLVGIDEHSLTVEVTEIPAYQNKWPIRLFLKNFLPTVPREKAPSWYERLLADRLL